MKNIEKALAARREKVLDKVVLFCGDCITTRAMLEGMANEKWEIEVLEEPSVRFNRVKFNRMSTHEQKDYQKKLDRKVKNYYAKKGDILVRLGKIEKEYLESILAS